jgi:hypothetical protein
MSSGGVDGLSDAPVPSLKPPESSRILMDLGQKNHMNRMKGKDAILDEF